jgi:TRAP-type mannitol/chloroaromatic compound transport system substrate-binding protein
MNSGDRMTNRRTLLAGLAGSGAILAAPAVHAETRIRWRMATSWPKNLPGPGVAAQFVAKRVGELSAGRFEIQLFGAGEIVPALQVLDAVGNGTVEMGHTAAFFWQGKMPAANFFTTIPFGPEPIEHLAWLERGGGQALWDELYRPFGVKPLIAGNTGPSMAGWFKREISAPGDLADLLMALSSGTIDGAEFLAPVNDLPLGLYKPAPYYYAPGFNKPNGAAEALIHLPTFEKLPPEFRAILETATMEAHSRGLTEAEAENSAALLTLVGNHQVQLRRFSPEIVAEARRHADAVIRDLAAKSPIGTRILASLQASREKGRVWRRVTSASALAMQGD